MSKLTDSAKVAMKAQTALMKAELKRNKIAMAFYSITIACFIFGVVALNMAVFYTMTGNDIARDAAVCLGGVNIVFGCIPIVFASRLKASDEEKLLTEIRDQASINLASPFSGQSSTMDKASMVAPLLNLVMRNISGLK
ncbi:hypothetical protein [uncultured Vibrio sp.]|uniref:hypothetical protein n=1 Tax=uncultured Vibrio sp. TaxID=114054 RepID=UPI002600D4E9|nr:hypothetical protein [uncultured Vibrio sp.]